MDDLVREMNFINAKNDVIQNFVDAGVNYNMAIIMNKWIAKKSKTDEVMFDLTVICGEEKAKELYNEAYMVYNEKEW